MVINGDGGKRGDIHPVLHLVSHRTCQFRIKPVYPLNKQDTVSRKRYPLTFELTYTFFKIVCGDLHLITFYEGTQMLVEQLQIKSHKGFVIIVAGLVPRSEMTVHKIIIKRDHNRSQQIGEQLYGEPLGESGLARRGRSGYEHYLGSPCPVTVSDCLGYPAYMFGVKCLCHIYHHARLPALHSSVKRTGITYTYDTVKLLICLECAEQFGLIPLLGRASRIRRVTSKKQETLLIRHKPKLTQKPCTRHQWRQSGISQSVKAVIYCI